MVVNPPKKTQHFYQKKNKKPWLIFVTISLVTAGSSHSFARLVTPNQLGRKENRNRPISIPVANYSTDY